MRRFRFRPRYRGVAWTSVGVGGALAIVSIATMGAALLPLASGGIGVALGLGYMLSPSWQLVVVIDDDALEVRSPKARKFRVAWTDVKQVVSSPTTHTCFVDGGTPETSLLVPGEGAPAPYDIEDKQALCDEIISRVTPDKVRTVETIASART